MIEYWKNGRVCMIDIIVPAVAQINSRIVRWIICAEGHRFRYEKTTCSNLCYRMFIYQQS